MAREAIVGVWYVKVEGAPFDRHVFTFHADGTMLQANPDAGDPDTSDSVGMGVWSGVADRFRAKFVENTADRATHTFVNKGEITFDLIVDGDDLRGTAEARFYDADDKLVRGPLPSTLTGRRVTLD